MYASTYTSSQTCNLWSIAAHNRQTKRDIGRSSLLNNRLSQAPAQMTCVCRSIWERNLSGCNHPQETPSRRVVNCIARSASWTMSCSAHVTFTLQRWSHREGKGARPLLRHNTKITNQCDGCTGSSTSYAVQA